MNWILLVASGVCGGVASILLRLSALEASAPENFSAAVWALRGLSIVSYGIGFVIYACALKRMNASIAYPLMVATSIIVVFIFTALHEHAVQPAQLSGAALIAVGAWLIVRGI